MVPQNVDAGPASPGVWRIDHVVVDKAATVDHLNNHGHLPLLFQQFAAKGKPKVNHSAHTRNKTFSPPDVSNLMKKSEIDPVNHVFLAEKVMTARRSVRQVLFVHYKSGGGAH